MLEYHRHGLPTQSLICKKPKEVFGCSDSEKYAVVNSKDSELLTTSVLSIKMFTNKCQRTIQNIWM